jgi:hypothetical protein
VPFLVYILTIFLPKKVFLGIAGGGRCGGAGRRLGRRVEEVVGVGGGDDKGPSL